MCFVTFTSTKIGSEHVLLALMEFESINAIKKKLTLSSICETNAIILQK